MIISLIENIYNLLILKIDICLLENLLTQS